MSDPAHACPLRPVRDKWLFRPALSPHQLDEREAASPSDLFTADPFKWDDADPQIQVCTVFNELPSDLFTADSFKGDDAHPQIQVCMVLKQLEGSASSLADACLNVA